MDSAWRHLVWLPHSSLGFQRPVGRRSYHNKPRLSRQLCVTPQATIARLWLIMVYGTTTSFLCSLTRATALDRVHYIRHTTLKTPQCRPGQYTVSVVHCVTKMS